MHCALMSSVKISVGVVVCITLNLYLALILFEWSRALLREVFSLVSLLKNLDFRCWGGWKMITLS